jgi:hypothetical protein
LGIVLNAAGASAAALEVLGRAIADAAAAADRPNEVRARLELEYVSLPRSSGRVGDGLLDVAASAIPVLEAAGDDRWLGRALLLSGWVSGARRGQHAVRREAAERALLHYERAGWPTSTPAGEIANALYYGPAPVDEAIARCEALLERYGHDRYGRANVEVFLGGLVAQTGAFDRAHALIASARTTYEELGHRTTTATTTAAVAGDVHVLAGDLTTAEATFRWLCGELEQTGGMSHLASRAGDLADVLYASGRLEEAAGWVGVARTHTADDDVDAKLLWMPVDAKLEARRGDVEAAVTTATEAARLAEATDGLNRRAQVQLDLREVLLAAGRRREAAAALELAAELFEAKGNVVGGARARSLRDDPALV